ncbi:MAG: MerR family DNA-binding transcriptional regulator [Candidatus Competibacteraceae bacterium]|nr:MerR family DNA-binding transcriptional regulator [Candidatus Competibacteraceae bacterium]MCB1810779.1 MerR family DNA-binding transcriptional regulator [Candidatus Competibacteraceae bacterium]
MSKAPACDPDKLYSIGELAREFELTTRAIRFYEDQGLLAPQRKGRRRIYSRRDRTRLKLTLRGKRLGLSLQEIKEILDLFDTPKGEQRQLAYFLRVLSKHRTQLEQQRLDIEAGLRDIERAQRECMELLGIASNQDDSASNQS